ncbi:MAG: hypothetical protein LBJ10_01125 [Clostridiales bacterium]|nr:hypothetical protein [Clostridiales bacterium]
MALLLVAYVLFALFQFVLKNRDINLGIEIPAPDVAEGDGASEPLAGWDKLNGAGGEPAPAFPAYAEAGAQGQFVRQWDDGEGAGADEDADADVWRRASGGGEADGGEPARAWDESGEPAYAGTGAYGDAHAGAEHGNYGETGDAHAGAEDASYGDAGEADEAVAGAVPAEISADGAESGAYGAAV